MSAENLNRTYSYPARSVLFLFGLLAVCLFMLSGYVAITEYNFILLPLNGFSGYIGWVFLFAGIKGKAPAWYQD
ncbi:hypothetical protein ACFODZ_09525 [Marinicella sediminis]|uniref:Uncharacterized protein n=1 Tax=Marinicella sediminis TaxID=1792834 RepID=A0ABV7JBB8_9GAMM|nr:hypothetical protein [Marinicella sediminis]